MAFGFFTAPPISHTAIKNRVQDRHISKPAAPVQGRSKPGNLSNTAFMATTKQVGKKLQKILGSGNLCDVRGAGRTDDRRRVCG